MHVFIVAGKYFPQLTVICTLTYWLWKCFTKLNFHMNDKKHLIHIYSKCIGPRTPVLDWPQVADRTGIYLLTPSVLIPGSPVHLKTPSLTFYDYLFLVSLILTVQMFSSSCCAVLWTHLHTYTIHLEFISTSIHNNSWNQVI